MSDSWSAEEVLNCRRNVFYLTFQIIEAIHDLAGHPTADEMFDWLEAPLVQDFALKLILTLVVNNCSVCNVSNCQ